MHNIIVTTTDKKIWKVVIKDTRDRRMKYWTTVYMDMRICYKYNHPCHHCIRLGVVLLQEEGQGERPRMIKWMRVIFMVVIMMMVMEVVIMPLVVVEVVHYHPHNFG
jgi:hypothetical protein